MPTSDSADAASRGGGHIVNVSSLAGIGVSPGLVTYSASKAALSHFTAGLRADFRGLPMGTTLVELGPVPTDMLVEANDYVPTAKSFERFYRPRVFAAVPREKVAADVVKAVRKGKRHVRLPKRARGVGDARRGAAQNHRTRTDGSTASREVSAPEGIRTPNLLIRSQMLYPLSYGRFSYLVVGGGERI